MASLKEEIEQGRPFSSIEEEAFLNLMRSSDCVSRAFARAARDWGVTATQYNVLRILRGAQPEGLTCSAIGRRMITAEPDITRLLNRLKALGLIEQERDKGDRRVVWTRITAAGLKLLAEMDPEILKLPQTLLAHMEPAELTSLIGLLEKVRGRSAEAQSDARAEV